jgi:hypothetical protein
LPDGRNVGEALTKFGTPIGVEGLSIPLPDVGKEDRQMPGPDFLVVESCRDGATTEKHTVVDARIRSRPAYCRRACDLGRGVAAG